MMDPAELKQQQMEQMAMMALAQVERAVDDELTRADNVTVRCWLGTHLQRPRFPAAHLPTHRSASQEDDLARIRSNRVAEMKRKAEVADKNKRNGHGSMDKITDQKEFFEASKRSERMIVLFTRDSNRRAIDRRTPALPPHKCKGGVWCCSRVIASLVT